MVTRLVLHQPQMLEIYDLPSLPSDVRFYIVKHIDSVVIDLLHLGFGGCDHSGAAAFLPFEEEAEIAQFLLEERGHHVRAVRCHKQACALLALGFLQQPVDQAALGRRKEVVLGLFEEDLCVVRLHIAIENLAALVGRLLVGEMQHVGPDMRHGEGGGGLVCLAGFDEQLVVHGLEELLAHLDARVALCLLVAGLGTADMVEVDVQRYQRLQSAGGVGEFERCAVIDFHLVLITLFVILIGHAKIKDVKLLGIGLPCPVPVGHETLYVVVVEFHVEPVGDGGHHVALGWDVRHLGPAVVPAARLPFEGEAAGLGVVGELCAVGLVGDVGIGSKIALQLVETDEFADEAVAFHELVGTLCQFDAFLDPGAVAGNLEDAALA